MNPYEPPTETSDDPPSDAGFFPGFVLGAFAMLYGLIGFNLYMRWTGAWQ